MADSKLAAEIATEYGRMLHGILPKIEDAIKRGKKSATFQVQAKFRVGSQGAIDVTLNQSASIPMDSMTIKLSYNNSQLSLFEGSTDPSTP